MRYLWIAAFFAAALAGCSSTPSQDEQAAASVEDRKPGAKPPVAQPIKQPPVAAVDLTAGKPGARSPLSDPASILSKRSIYFDFDRYDVRDEYKALVEAHARYLRDNARAKMLVQGNTDERGGREYNLALGQKRAEAVRRSLGLLGVPDGQMEAVSFGKEKLAAQGNSEDVHAQNRRAELSYR